MTCVSNALFRVLNLADSAGEHERHHSDRIRVACSFFGSLFQVCLDGSMVGSARTRDLLSIGI
jgi:hypothetical protein